MLIKQSANNPTARNIISISSIQDNYSKGKLDLLTQLQSDNFIQKLFKFDQLIIFLHPNVFEPPKFAMEGMSPRATIYSETTRMGMPFQDVSRPSFLNQGVKVSECKKKSAKKSAKKGKAKSKKSKKGKGKK